MKQIPIGADVWFVSKFNDVVTGKYEGTTIIPSLDGDVQQHALTSTNAFGIAGDMEVRCVVPDHAIHVGKP